MSNEDETDLAKTIGAIGQWLAVTDLEEHLPTLLEHGYNSLAKCCRIDESALVAMGIESGEEAKKFLEAVERLKASGTVQESPSPSQSPDASSPSVTTAESIDPDQVLEEFIADMEATKKRQVTFLDVDPPAAKSSGLLDVKLSGKSREEIIKRISVMTMTGAHTAELDALLDELYEMVGEGDDSTNTDPNSAETTTAKKPSVSDLDFLKFLEEMKAGSGADMGGDAVDPIVGHGEDFLQLNAPNPASIETLNQELSQDVEEIIRQAEESNPKRRKDSAPAPLPTPPPLPQEPEALKSPKDDVKMKLEVLKGEIEQDKSLSTREREVRLKETKILIAMEKLKDARQQKLVVKLLCEDGSSKMLIIEEGMTAHDVCDVMAKKTHRAQDPNYCIVEKLADLFIERSFEDHESVVPVLMSWPRVHENTLHFVKKPNKYRLCTNPRIYMPDSHPFAASKQAKFTEEVIRNMIIKELYVTKQLPDIEGQLHYMIGVKGKWKKHYFSVRKSGLYYSTKGKSTSILDVVRLLEWCDVNIYSGSMYKKKYKAPTNFCLTLLPSGNTDVVKKHMCHLCMKTKKDLYIWIHGIRLAKYGIQLYEDFQRTQALMPWVELEMGTDEGDASAAAPTPEGGVTDESEGDTESTERAESSLEVSAPIIQVSDDGDPGYRGRSERSLTLLQKRFQQAWGIGGGTVTDDLSDTYTSMGEAEPRSPTAGTGVGVSDEGGMFSVRLK